MQALNQGLLPFHTPQRQVPVAGRRCELGRSVHGIHRKDDTGLSCLHCSVTTMTNSAESHVEQFFERYAAALLARDAKAIAEMYAVPSLILFPGHAVPVSDAKQTEDFFASAWSQYDGIETVDNQITILAEAPGTVWADIVWSYDGQPQERFCYQLVERDGGYQIGVLTPMA